eukprot:8575285-Alexandrium_andersonii.AAC.1
MGAFCAVSHADAESADEADWRARRGRFPGKSGTRRPLGKTHLDAWYSDCRRQHQEQSQDE